MIDPQLSAWLFSSKSPTLEFKKSTAEKDRADCQHPRKSV
jgi:hypothetical protein